MATPDSIDVPETGRRQDAFREGNRLCPGCFEAETLHAIGRATDNGRKTVLVLGTFCSEAATLCFPDVVAWGRGPEEPDALARTLGVIQAPAASAPSVAEGVREVAELLSEAGAWRAEPPNVVAVTADAGGLADGLDALVQTLHRGRRVTLFVLIHEVYGASRFPVPATALAPGVEPLDHLGLAVASGAELVAQVSPAFPELLARTCEEALACPASAVVFVPAPCPSGWRIADGEAATVGRLACQAGLAPCFRKRRGERGEVREVPPRGKRPRVEEVLARQQRFEHLARLQQGRAVVQPGREAEVALLQAFADRNVERLEALAAR